MGGGGGGGNFLQDCFWCCLVWPYFYCMIECSVGLNCDQMEEGEQYSEYLVERNPRAYMSLRDYRYRVRNKDRV